MPKFYNANDLNFIKSIAEEVVDYVVEHKQEDTEIKLPSAIVKWDENGQLIIIRA
jgi:hypothetical protein